MLEKYPEKTSDLVSEYLLREILSGTRRPGSLVDKDELSREVFVYAQRRRHRIPEDKIPPSQMRESLGRLEQIGVLNRMQGKPPTIREPGKETGRRESFLQRLTNEIFAVNLAVQNLKDEEDIALTALSDLEQATQTLFSIAACYSASSRVEFLEADLKCHIALMQAAGFDKQLVGLLQKWFYEAILSWPSFSSIEQEKLTISEIAVSHVVLADCIHARNAIRASAVLEYHLSSCFERCDRASATEALKLFRQYRSSADDYRKASLDRDWITNQIGLAKEQLKLRATQRSNIVTVP